MLETTGLTIGIHPKDENEPTTSGTLSIGFMVDEIKDETTLLDRNNIKFDSEDDGKSWLDIHFKDLDGTILYFVQPKW